MLAFSVQFTLCGATLSTTESGKHQGCAWSNRFKGVSVNEETSGCGKVGFDRLLKAGLLPVDYPEARGSNKP